MMNTEEKIIKGILDRVEKDPILMDLRVGATWTLARTTAGYGMSSTLAYRMVGSPKPHVRDAGHLIGQRAKDVALLALSDRPLEAAIGMAVLNSMIDPWELDVVELNASDLLIELGRGGHVGIIGSFPFIKELKQHVEKLYVFDLKGGKGVLGPDRYELLKAVDVVGITGTVFLTHTFDKVMSHVNSSAIKVMIGPTTPMHNILFDMGFHALCGVGILNWDELVLGASQGGNLKQLGGFSYLTAVRGKR